MKQSKGSFFSRIEAFPAATKQNMFKWVQIMSAGKGGEKEEPSTTDHNKVICSLERGTATSRKHKARGEQANYTRQGVKTCVSGGCYQQFYRSANVKMQKDSPILL